MVNKRRIVQEGRREFGILLMVVKRSLNVTLLTVTLPLFIICLVYVEANSFSGFVTYHSSLMVFVEVVEIGEGVQGELCVLSMVSLSLALRGG